MTPDDMEGRLLARLSVLYDDARNGTPVTDPNEHDADELAEIIADLRALLLDYQERGRALEDLLALPVAKQAFVYLDKGIGTKTPAAAWLRARATLKGKSHD